MSETQEHIKPAPECGPPVTLAQAPTGLFVHDGSLGFKAETETKNPRTGTMQTDAYTVPGGEYFWGHALTPEAREALIVRPVTWQEIDEDFSGFRILKRLFEAVISHDTAVFLVRQNDPKILDQAKEFLS